MFIPAAVLARAVELAAYPLAFSTVVRRLELEGNGTWPRKTLMRRIRSSASSRSGQNTRGLQATSPAADIAGDVAKTGHALGLLECEAVLAAQEYATPAYHKALAELHAATPGPCGCYSCGFAKRSPAVQARARGRRRR